MREIIEWRSEKRKQLRQEYLKQVHHPTKHQLVNDNGIERFAIMRLTHEYQSRLTGRAVVLGIGWTFGTIFVCTWFVKKGKENEEHKYRTGQVSYADRQFKFT